jgi:hypothetical protein
MLRGLSWYEGIEVGDAQHVSQNIAGSALTRSVLPL